MDHLVNNWVFGEVSPKLGGRFDLDMYWQGCETLQNFRTLIQGGITRRPPLKHVGTSYNGRLIPFTLSSGLSFLIELSAGKLRVWKDSAKGLETAIFASTGLDYVETPYSLSEVWSVQSAQYYDRLYLVHRDHKQKILLYSANAFSLTDFNITKDATTMFGQTANNYPGVIGICQNRIWLASTINNPYTTWVSRPPYSGSNNHSDFTTFDVVQVETEVIKSPDQWPMTETDEGDQIIDFSNKEAFMETKIDDEEVISAKCAMEIELASGRNDTIRWIAGMDNIFIGTAANEWMCPFDIDPTKQSASLQSSHGSREVLPKTLHDGIFFVTNGNALREFARTQNGSASSDLTFTADHILDDVVMDVVTLKDPNPMVYCVLANGDLAVLVYEKMYGVQSWAKWTTDGNFISLAVKEDQYGQHLYAIVERGIHFFLERFDFEETEHFIDRHTETVEGEKQYVSLMVGNRFDMTTDSGLSIGKSKKAREVWVRCLDTGKVSTGVLENQMQTSPSEVGSGDYRIPISGGAMKELRIRIQSVEDDPMTLLAMTYDVEVN